MTPDSLLVIIVPGARYDDVVDALMGFEEISGFSSFTVAGFSREHSHLSRRELVQGFGDYQRFDVLCDGAMLTGLLAALGAAMGVDRLRYWVLPVSAQGTVGG